MKSSLITWQPRQVLLFTGHRIDAPDRITPRFPQTKVPQATTAIAKVLQQLDAGQDDLALTQGASGGDLLFAEACQARGVSLQLLQPFAEIEFIARSVAPAAEDWCQRYADVKAKLNAAYPPRCLPDDFAASMDSPYARCNLWLLQTALDYGAERLVCIGLWNGATDDGPGGTAHMLQQVQQQQGQVIWLDTRTLA